MNIDTSDQDGLDTNVASAGMNTGGRSILPKFIFPKIRVYPRSLPWAGTLMHWEIVEYDWQGNPQYKRAHALIPVNGRRVPPYRNSDDNEYYEDLYE